MAVGRMPAQRIYEISLGPRPWAGNDELRTEHAARLPAIGRLRQ